MIDKKFETTKMVPKKTIVTHRVYEPGTLLKCTSPHVDFKKGEIVIVNWSQLGDDNILLYRATWFFNSYLNNRNKVISIDRLVTINNRYFEPTTFCELQEYMRLYNV